MTEDSPSAKPATTGTNQITKKSVRASGGCDECYEKHQPYMFVLKRKTPRRDSTAGRGTKLEVRIEPLALLRRTFLLRQDFPASQDLTKIPKTNRFRGVKANSSESSAKSILLLSRLYCRPWNSSARRYVRCRAGVTRSCPVFPKGKACYPKRLVGFTTDRELVAKATSPCPEGLYFVEKNYNERPPQCQFKN